MTERPGRARRVIGDISIYPIGEGTSLSRYVQAAYRAMHRDPNLRLIPSAMSTVVEARDLTTILRAVERAHAALVRMGAQRIAILLRIDHRRDKPESVEYKVARVTGPR